jgi:hypothetical protein
VRTGGVPGMHPRDEVRQSPAANHKKPNGPEVTSGPFGFLHPRWQRAAAVYSTISLVRLLADCPWAWMMYMPPVEARREGHFGVGGALLVGHYGLGLHQLSLRIEQRKGDRLPVAEVLQLHVHLAARRVGVGVHGQARGPPLRLRGRVSPCGRHWRAESVAAASSDSSYTMPGRSVSTVTTWSFLFFFWLFTTSWAFLWPLVVGLEGYVEGNGAVFGNLQQFLQAGLPERRSCGTPGRRRLRSECPSR